MDMPSDPSAYNSRPRIIRTPLDQRREVILIRYRPDLRENETSQEISEAPGGVGITTELDLPLVYELETADRVAYQENQRELAARESIELEVDPRDVDGTLVPGTKIKVPSGIISSSDSQWIVKTVRNDIDKSVLIEAEPYRSGVFEYDEDRFLLSADDTYDPPVDFSETPPAPLRNFTAETVSTMDDETELFECAIEFTTPKENYSNAEIHFALGSEAATFRTFEDPGNPGHARFDLPLDLTRYSVIGYSVSENGLLLGYPVFVSVNESPSADAGDDSTVSAGASVTLDGSGSSDPDNDALTFLWEQLSGTPVSIVNSTSEEASFTAPNTSSTHVLEFQLTVSDGVSTGIDSVVVNVNRRVVIPPSNPPGRPGGSTTGPTSLDFSVVWYYSVTAPTTGGTPTYYQERRNQDSNVSDWYAVSLPRNNIPVPHSNGGLVPVYWVEVRACNADGCGSARRLTAP